MRAYSDLEALIDGLRVLARSVADVDEPLVDAGAAGLAVDRTRTGVQQLSDNPFQLRSAVVERLLQAQGQLPAGFRIQLKEGWRPVWGQERLWWQSLEQLRGSRPNLSEAELRRENTRFTAEAERPWTQPSRTRSSSPNDSLGITRRDGTPAAGSQGGERPGRPAPRTGPGSGRVAGPLFDPADLGEGPGLVYLLCLAVRVSVHRPAPDLRVPVPATYG